ncbi:BQ2448_3183 [Microbotryum intermedium]|uniref:BQ2448_3183 protein n=1 Tax=Microbotryum intermedium TaxID=269621 RepID=A0A238FEH7_9BASI|nr:BQ2448_3183 [Microbotryum intermedium]
MCGIAFALSYSTPTSSLSEHEHDPDYYPHENGQVTSDGKVASPSQWILDCQDETRKSEVGSQAVAWWGSVTEAVKPRGPDASADYCVKLRPTQERPDAEMRFHTSVLHMRGDVVTPQPFVDPDTGDVFLWNGEVFDGLSVDLHDNDGSKLFHELQQAGPRAIPAVLQSIEGPYAFVYFSKTENKLWFGRDHLGRRSLLLHRPTPSMPHLILSSCAPSGHNFVFGEWEEVACDALYSFALDRLSQNGVPTFMPTPRSFKSASQSSEDSLLYPYDRILTTLPSPDQLVDPGPYETQPIPLDLQKAVIALEAALELSIRQRILNVPSHPPPPHARIAILFSGGLDCTTLACLVDRVLDGEDSIDLINIAFENPRAIQSKNVLQDRQGSSKKKKDRRKDGHRDGEESVGEEVMVDLGEVSIKEEKEVSIYDVPDRLTGIASWRELKRLRPKRGWNFVEVDVPYQEMTEHRSTVIDLMRPQSTIMDLSISLAFYFAARGRGHLASDEPTPSPRRPYHSQARVLLSGLGADELVGGYARHRKAFYTQSGGTPSPLTPGSWPHLIQEMQMDLDRLPIRNLGRDDRILSHHGKEARYPFLAAHVIDLCTRLPIWLKCDPRLGEGVGDKRLLRLVATRLGLGDAARLRKRAIHFGARTAKMELGSGKDKGENVLEY